MKLSGSMNEARRNQYVVSLRDNQIQLAPRTQLARFLTLINIISQKLQSRDIISFTLHHNYCYIVLTLQLVLYK